MPFVQKGQQRSTTKKAKEIIRKEIKTFYSPKYKGGGKSALSNMKLDADAYNCGDHQRYKHSDQQKGASLVDGGCFACYYSDQAKMLEKIYGKDKVKTWDGNKIHAVYRGLIGREYGAMLREQEKKVKK